MKNKHKIKSTLSSQKRLYHSYYFIIGEQGQFEDVLLKCDVVFLDRLLFHVRGVFLCFLSFGGCFLSPALREGLVQTFVF